MNIYRIFSNKIKYNSIWNQIFCTAILDMIFASICLLSYLRSYFKPEHHDVLWKKSWSKSEM